MSDSRADTEANEPPLVFPRHPELMRVERWGETDTELRATHTGRAW